MSYIENNLQAHEELAYLARATVLPYIHGIVAGIALIPSVALYPAPFFPGTVSALGALTALLFVAFWRATELGVTDRRVVVKTGLVARKVRELHINRIEGIDVEQSILGRIFNYGTVVVRGVGTDLDPIEHVHAPVRFKSAFFDATRSSTLPAGRASRS